MNCRVRGEYPADWPEIARAVKEAAEWRCERCGHCDDPARRVVGEPGRKVPSGRLPCDEHCTHASNGKQRSLTVHHLDGDKANCEPWNLAALCQVCHLSVQARVDFYRPYLLPHTPWMARHVQDFNSWAREHGRQPLPFAGVLEAVQP